VILSALAGYYDRMADDPDVEVARMGFSRQKIHYCLVLNKNGGLQGDPADIWDHSGKRPVPRSLIVPFDASVKRTVAVLPNFLWDNTSYVLGADAKDKPDRARKCFEAFRELHHEILDSVDDPGAKALLHFLDTWNPDDAPDLPMWEEMAGQNLVFQLEGERQFLHERKALRDAWVKHLAEAEDEESGLCLVTGEEAPIAKLHPSVKGVRGAQTSGASVVSFNQDAFISYGKEQSLNAPVGKPAAFAYTTALNHLLADERRKVQIGDATTVFWTARPTPAEDFLAMVFDPPAETEDGAAEDAGRVKELRDFLEAVRAGKPVRKIAGDPDVPFFVLGLSPNAARISVRFWHVGTVGEMAERIGAHFQDISIQRQYENEPEFPGMWRLLRETALQRKLDNISPLLAGAFMRAILTGGTYPRNLLSAVIGRIRADQTVNYFRAALVKGCLVREFRFYPNRKIMEVPMALDTESTNTAYRLGRLFAVLEKVQKDANPGIKATIKDRFFSSAAATPRSVFPRLISMAQHHVEKAEYGGVSDKHIETVLQGIEGFPAHLNLEEQGLFMLGYYHQRPALFQKSEKTAKKGKTSQQGELFPEDTEKEE